MAGTFQDQLMTELRLARVSNIDEDNEVLQRFLPRFNVRIRVPAERAQSPTSLCHRV